MTNCPSCGSSVVYVGLMSIRCRGSSCANYEAPPPPPVLKIADYRSWEWARAKQNDEYKLEWKEVRGSTWQELAEDLDDDDPGSAHERDEYEYRLEQSYYEVACEHPRGSPLWAIEQETNGRTCVEYKDTWEIVGML